MQRLQGPALHEPAPEPQEPTQEEETVLGRSVKLWFPDLRRDMTDFERTTAVQDHITATAIMRGELSRLRLEANAQLLELDEEWGSVQVGRGTKQEVADARARARPDLAQRRKLARWTVDRCTEEIERMEADYTSASRAYTIISGS